MMPTKVQSAGIPVKRNEVLERVVTGSSGDNIPVVRSQAEIELLEASAESYLNASHWRTRRQIL